MAKTLKGELSEIMRLESSAMRDLDRARMKKEQLITPLVGKMSSIFTEQARQFLAANLERIAEMKLDKPGMEKRINAMLEEMLSRPGGEAGSTDVRD